MSASNATALLYHTLFTTLMQINHTIVPSGDGVLYRIKLPNDPQILEGINLPKVDVNSIVFKLYTREVSDGRIIPFDYSMNILERRFNSKEQTVVVINGYKESEPLKSCNTIRDAFLNQWNCNVIIVDWREAINSPSYEIVAKSVPEMADHVAKFLNSMRLNAALDTQKLKMVGFSLGAHIASLAARVLKQSDSPVAEVIALDPVGLMFEDKDPDGRVDRSHADHVQVIHTNAGQLGMYRAVGTSDFYANEGTTQSGCPSDFSGWTCSHERSYLYYSESIGNPQGFPSRAVVGIPRETTMGGPYLSPLAKGYMFTFMTTSKKPFASSVWYN